MSFYSRRRFVNFLLAIVGNALVQEDTQQETQQSELNVVTLERNSHNFLE